MRITDTADLWWKTAVVYCLDVETYLDSDGDGTGDLTGLAQRLDYLSDLGVTCIWLMPLYPTAGRDDGYDVSDFYGVDSRLGTHGDLVEVIRTAKDRGMRVIADLVVNHTSDTHPWFRSARSSKDSPYRDFYVWRSDEPEDTSDQVVFPDAEGGIWSYDEKTEEWYLHRFYSHQPDLNVANPKVRDEIAKVMCFWLTLGLSGFRVDAVPFFLGLEGTTPQQREDFPDPHSYLRSLRELVGRRTGDGILLGEVNLPHEEQLTFFGGPDGDELTMMFDFIGMQAMYLSLARRDAGALTKALVERPVTATQSQWATFVRNHDELTLDKLSDAERQEVFAAFGPDPGMQLFGRGLRRRLPPMLDGDPRRVRMVYSLLFSMPGTPVLFYGEEIGMGENLDAPDRQAVRTPMQWTSGRNGGFSDAPASRLPNPVVEGGFGPAHVNVSDQRRDPESLLQFITLLAHRYRECPELGWGDFAVLEQEHPSVLVHRCTWERATLVAVHNLGPEPREVVVDLSGLGDLEPDQYLVDLLQQGRTDLTDGRGSVSLDGYGYRWLRLTGEHETRLL